jgi:xanthine dehydrogenase YagR molybdenum-binding subunit
MTETPPPSPRVDGPVKAAGAARYTADRSGPGLNHAVLVTAGIPRGRVRAIDTAEAERYPGVRAVVTYRNALRLHPVDLRPAFAHGVLPLQDDEVRYEGEPVAAVVADRLERAEEAAAAIRVEYDRAPARTDFAVAARRPHLVTPPERWGPADTLAGDVEAGLAAADVVVSRCYETAARHHCALEPSATRARWDGGRLTLFDATQGVFVVRLAVATALGMSAEDVRVVCEVTGGGFGSKGFVWPHQLVAAMLARMLHADVRLVLSRAQSFTAHGYQPPTRQEVTLGARRDGLLTAIRHTSVNATASYADHVELAARASRSTYASPAVETRHRVAPVDTVLPTPMRAPQEGPGMFALESAMDELAGELGLDPLELRLRNYADTDPTSGTPFSSKELRACYERGATDFGWAARKPQPRAVWDGTDLIGWGMATAVMHTVRFPARARIRVDPDGTVTVRSGTQEIGTGTSTVLARIAAEVLACDPGQVRVELGDTVLPEAGMSVGSSTALSVGSAVHAAARALVDRLAALGGGLPVGEVCARHGLDGVEADGAWTPGAVDRTMSSFGAVFAEVAVDEQLCTVHVRRVLGVYSAGRILSPTTARSQMTGGMVWGIGQALTERSTVDTELGRFVAKDLSGYLLPVNGDVPDLEAIFVDEVDPYASDVGARGIGELGAVGVAAAIANAVFHATGIRVRQLPITPESLLDTPPAGSRTADDERGGQR